MLWLLIICSHIPNLLCFPSVFIHYTEIHPQHKTLRDTVALFSHQIGGHFLSNRIL